MKFFIYALIILNVSFASGQNLGPYPLSPDLTLTPGSLCSSPSEYRYPERVPYCERNVATEIKVAIYKKYRNLGYKLDPKFREDFKIDHLIPLCAGGSNRENNLWPQHKSIFEKTDILESLGCGKLKEGKIKQSNLIEKILKAKRNIQLVNTIIDELYRL